MSRLGRASAPIRSGALLAVLGLLLCATEVRADASADLAGLSRLSIEELANIEITSVSRRSQPLSSAPSAIFVIGSDDIRRAAATSLPEALRLAPNLQVARLSSATWAITARGFNHTTATANKLQVLVDGRSIYTPLYSGVFWDVQTMMLDDVERIEVVSGPGGSLWGVNAVNGVINVTSRKADDTQGLLVELTGGAQERSFAMRQGGVLGENLAWRVYGQAAEYEASSTTTGLNGGDGWDRAQGGFRVDWEGGADALTLHGDVYDGGTEPVPNARAKGRVDGGNLVARWTRTTASGGELTAQAYYDRSGRTIVSGIKDRRNIWNVDGQYSSPPIGAHTIVAGGGYMLSSDHFVGAPGTSFLSPAARDLEFGNAFVQDEIALGDQLTLTVGVRWSFNDYTGSEWMPAARLAWRPADDLLLWTAASRAVRAPARFDRDLINPGLVAGGPDFQSEYLTAYEVGYRGRPLPSVSLSLSAFYNVYDGLRSTEAAPAGLFPLTVQNRMEGETWGLEGWGTWDATDWWRLSAGFSTLQKDLRLRPGSRDIFGVSFAGNDPDYQVQIQSSMSLGARAELDVDVRRVGALPSPVVPAYTELNARLGWRANDHVELWLAGANLLDERHLEFVSTGPAAREIRRNVRAGVRWAF